VREPTFDTGVHRHVEVTGLVGSRRHHDTHPKVARSQGVTLDDLVGKPGPEEDRVVGGNCNLAPGQ
jgi:hypothetical protein